ncbi:hypothetical protein [Streptomyces sp. B21-083]|uniref:hypothetical protein n=1 Tax=Streptomyces sp. B21-083 TaxID=3039410 RepID=UPI002FF0B8B1
MSRRPPFGEGETGRTARARTVLRTAVEEKTGALVAAPVLAERASWAASLVSGIVEALVTGHWNTADVDRPASGEDSRGRKLPSNAWMACGV